MSYQCYVWPYILTCLSTEQLIHIYIILGSQSSYVSYNEISNHSSESFRVR